eukprot:1159674-Pelagomonas_calceolata.AAC.10
MASTGSSPPAVPCAMVAAVRNHPICNVKALPEGVGPRHQVQANEAHHQEAAQENEDKQRLHLQQVYM